MHPQSCQVTQEDQVLYSYPVNQYGQPVGNAWLNSNQIQSSQGIPSSGFNQQVHCRPSQHHLSSQHGTYPPQTSYNGNGSHIMSSPNRNSVCPTAVSAPALTSGPYNSSCGYSIQPDNSQMVLSHQGAMTQSTHIPTLGNAQDWHARNSSQTSVAQSTPRQPQSQTTQDWYMQTNSHTNMIVLPNEILQMLSGQPQTTVNNANVNRSSHSEQTLQLQTVQQHQSSSQVVTVNNQYVQNRSSHPSQALQLQKSHCQPGISNQGRYGQHIQTFSETPVSSPASLRPSHHFGNDANHGQISRRNYSPTTSSTMASQFTMQNVSSGVNGLKPPPPYPGTHSQSAPSKNMSVSSSGSSDFLPSTTRANCLLPPRCHVLGSPSSVHTSQTNHMFVDSSSRNKNRAPYLGNGHSVNGALAQRQNPSVVSPQQRLLQQQHSQRKADLYNIHTPNLHNKHAAAVLERHPRLTCLLVSEDTQHIEQSIAFMDCNGSNMQEPPNKSVQTHRAVAVVPPISKQPGDGGKGKKCDDVRPSNYDDHHPLLMKDLRSLADDKKIKEAIVLPFDTGSAAVRKTSSCVKSSEVGCPPEADVNDESAVCNNLDSLDSLPPENKATPKDQNNEESCGPDVFFGMPVVTFNLKMLKVLEITQDLIEEEEIKRKYENRMNNKPEFADAVRDLYWGGGKHLNYDFDSTFANILKEAAEFDTEENKMLFDTMKVENLNQLKQKGHILTNCFDGVIATELDKSSWRNVNDESLDIDRELADEDFTKEICGSLLECFNEKSQERNLLSSIQAPGTKSPHVSKEDICPSSSVAKPDTASLYNENCTGKAEQTKYAKSQDDLRQKVTVPNNNSDRQSISKKENKEDDVSLQVSVSLRNLNRHSYEKSAAADTQNDTVFNIFEMSEEQTSKQCFRIGSDSTAVLTNPSSQDSVDSGHNSRDLDYEMNVTEEGMKLSERLCEQVETSEKDCPVSPADTILSIKLTALSSENEDKVDFENVHQDLIRSPQKGPPSPSNDHSYESYPDSLKIPDEPMLSMKLTVLSMDEFKALSKELWPDSGGSENNVALSSPICIDSEDDDSEVDLVQTCKTIGHLSQMMKQEKITIFEEEIPSFPSIAQVLKQCEIPTGRTEKLNDDMENSATKGLTSPLKDSKKEGTLEHTLPSQNACRKGHALTTHPGAKSANIHIPYSSPSGIKASSPISPSAPIRTTNSDVMKESSSLQTERSSASHGHEISSPTSTLQSVPLKKCRMEPLEDCENSKLTDVLCPSGHSPLKVTKKCNESQKTGTDIMKTLDNKRHRDNDASLTITSRENVLNPADTSESPESPSGAHRKRKHAMFKLYGSRKVDSKDANEMNQYRTNCERNLPPLLNILYCPDKTSARDKIRKSWGDSFVPTIVKYRRLSSSEDKNREKNVPERPANHCKLSGKDKDEQQRSSGKEYQSERKSSGRDKDRHKQRSSSKEHRSDHRKRKRRSLSLSEMRREAERKTTSKKSPQEKQDMVLHVIKRYKQIHMKV